MCINLLQGTIEKRTSLSYLVKVSNSLQFNAFHNRAISTMVRLKNSHASLFFPVYSCVIVAIGIQINPTPPECLFISSTTRGRFAMVILHFPFQSSPWVGRGSSHDLHYRSPYKCVSTEWRPHVHSGFRASRPFDSGVEPRSYWKMMKHGPLYPFFCGLSRVAMAFRQRCLKDGSSLLVVWPEVGTVRSRMCLGESLDPLQGHSLARCITLNWLCPETLRR